MGLIINPSSWTYKPTWLTLGQHQLPTVPASRAPWFAALRRLAPGADQDLGRAFGGAWIKKDGA